MPEIKTPPIIVIDSEGNKTVSFTGIHTWSDVVRWITENREDGETVLYLLKEALYGTTS